MKWLVGTVCICMFLAGGQAQKPSNSGALILEPDRFDQWGDISLIDEDAHLEKIASQAKEWPLSIIHIVIHAGQTACVGEAKARGIRDRNYLVQRQVAPERIVLVDAGWRKEVSVQVWIWPPEMGNPKVAPADVDLKRSAVRLEKNCKIKVRRVHS